MIRTTVLALVTALGMAASIGVATMERDGTIVLQIRTTDGIHAHARLV
jgi:hypothetical protein